MKVIKKILKGIFVIILIVVVAVMGFFAFMIFDNSNSENYVKATYEVSAEEKVKIILDCDNSLGSFGDVDDGLVLSYLLNKPEAELLGVTTTFGGDGYKHKYTVNMLETAGREDIPVYQGEQSANEGITAAARFLAETAAKYPGEVTIIATGPVGNLQAAYDVDNNFYDNVKQIIIMGGYVEELTAKSEKIDELNISSDAEAAYGLLHSSADVTIITVTAREDALFLMRDFKKLQYFPISWEFFTVLWTAENRLTTGNNYFIAGDMMAAIYAFHPEYFESGKEYISPSVQNLQTGYLNISRKGETKLVTVVGGIYEVKEYYDDMFINLNRQGR